jgi:diguanylate cyclase (GGDEF)-like protein
MNSKYQELENARIELEGRFEAAQESLMRCPVTGLFNKEFFHAYLTKALGSTNVGTDKLTLLILAIDSLNDININFGSDEGNNTMRNLAYLMQRQFGDQDRVFRLEGGIFAIVLSGLTKEQALKEASTLKTTVFESRMTIVPISISIGMYHSDELMINRTLPVEDRRTIMEQTARFRLKLARKQGKSVLVYESLQQTTSKAAYTVLLVDEDGLHRDLVQNALEQEHYTVLVAGNGALARDLVEREEPDLIICEQMIPKLSGFTLRKQLLGSPLRKSIPFILLSHTKNERTVNRAIGLGIQHFLAKPVMIAELVGIVGLLTSRSQGSEG